MFAIYRKELSSYFINPIGYIYLGIFLVFSALLCCYTTIIAGTYNTSQYFFYLIVAFIILIPLLTMRLFAEEKKMRTEQMLLTAPVTITGMVLGKYFAALTLFVGGVLLSCINFIPLYVIASAERGGTSYSMTHIGPVTGQIIGSLLAIILLGAALIAIGTFISAMTENQLSAAVITIGVIAAMVLLNVFNILTDASGQPIIGSYAIRFVIDWVSALAGGFGFYALMLLTVIVVPIISCAISALLSIPYTAIMRLVESKFVIHLIGYIVLIGVGFAVYGVFLETLTALMQDGNIQYIFDRNTVNIISIVTSYLYPSNLFANVLFGEKILSSILLCLSNATIAIISNKYEHIFHK